ncbi:MAG: sulfatase-like hydrolase/transferase [Chloroflexota bacterium]|nr:sulfatase-like hydrolase/transferase [Chloroflexota bacterium]
MPRPNFLWICTNGQRPDTLGCYGNELVDTPHLDRLAQDGLVFENAFCQSPVCNPSRASFLTGRYPRTTGTRQNNQGMPADEVLVTKLLADASYSCGLAGMLHLGESGAVGGQASGKRQVETGYSMVHRSNSAAPGRPTNAYTGWLGERWLDYHSEPYQDSRWVEAGMPAEHHHTTWCAQMAINFIEAHAAGEQPWLFSVNIFDPHFPFDPPAGYLERWADRLDEIPLPNLVEGEIDGKPEFHGQHHRDELDPPQPYPYLEMADEDHRLLTAAYWAMGELIDAQVGRLLETLEQTGQLENTLVIFTSDHGEMLGDHGIYGKGPYFFEPATHVPLVLSQPGGIEPGRSYALVELVDLAPTLLEAAGIDIPPGMQGKPLTALLQDNGDRDQHRDDVYCEFYNAIDHPADPPVHSTMVRTRRHKLVLHHSTNEGELYDLREDPGENVNRWDAASHSEIKIELLIQLANRMAWTVDPLPERGKTNLEG